MLNKVMIIGRLGADPELRYSGSGVPMVTLNVATDESYLDKEKNRVEKTEWHRVVVFQRQAENCANFLGKGSLVYVEGSLQTRKWQDQQGQDRYTTEIRAARIQFLDRKGDRQGAPSQGFASNRPDAQNQSWPKDRPQASRQSRPMEDEDLGPAFPSEASMDEVPF